MARILFGDGAIGDIVKQVQDVLTKAGFSTNGVDGWYGNGTHKAVSAFQSSRDIPPTGLVDDGLWPMLMNSPIPAVAQRALQLTASFEGHGFGLAEGNFDGALLTWGIIGFTMSAGEVQEIVLAINNSHPEIVQQAFASNTDELIGVMQASQAAQTTWANQHTLANGSLAEPWKTMFATFGSSPEVQAEQMNHVQSDYMVPAINTAKSLGFTSELGLALCFDIHVQDGGINNTAMQQIQQNSTPGMAEPDLRVVVANAVADRAKPKWSDDVRARKLAIANGQGTVHGHLFVMENCGLSGNFSAPELA
jgi:peptidoglycan hydrolase-like protein with peptidoglycan-binding domain